MGAVEVGRGSLPWHGCSTVSLGLWEGAGACGPSAFSSNCACSPSPGEELN